MISSHIVINVSEINEKLKKINDVETTVNKNNTIDAIDILDKYDQKISTHLRLLTDTSLDSYAASSSLLSKICTLTNNVIIFKNLTQTDCTLDIIQLMGLEMPPVRRKGYTNNNYAMKNGPHTSTSLPNLHQNVSLRSSNSSTSGPLISQHLRGTPDLAVGDDSSDSGVSSRSPTPNNNLLPSAGAAGDQGLPNEHFTKKYKDAKHVNGASTNNIGKNNGTRHSGSLRSHSYHQNHQHQHNRNHGHRNYTGNNNFNNNSNNSADGNNAKKKNYHSNRHSSPMQQSAGRGRLGSGLIIHIPPSMSHVNSIVQPMINHSPLNSVMYTFPTPSDRFLAKSHLVQITKTPSQLTNGTIWDELSKAIWNKFLTNQQTTETYKKKLNLWRCLFLYIKTISPRYNLYLVGSTLSGFGSNTSDVDMCLIVRRQEMDQRSEALLHLSSILYHLSTIEGIEKLDLVQAKVPILKFRERSHGIDVDLNCNNAVGIRNTHLLSCYSKIDWRVRPLVLVVKLWAQWHDINDAKNMTISSYSLALMVIHFLQCGVHPPVLPCLHILYKDKFSPDRDISNIDIHEEIEYECKNNQSLGELLVQFFAYYNTFDYAQCAVSVRLASRVPIEECRKARSLKNEPHQWKYLCVEEPFDLTNTARSVYDLEAFERIRRIIRNTYTDLNATHALESIFKIERTPVLKNYQDRVNQLQHQQGANSIQHVAHQHFLNNTGWYNHHQQPHNFQTSVTPDQLGSNATQTPSSTQSQISTQIFML